MQSINGNTSEMMTACDQIFINRLKTQPKALTMAFWEKHFEWKELVRYPSICGSVLDFGCGSGHSDVLLARHGMTIHGIDLSPIGIAIADYFRGRENPSVQDRVSFSVGDVTQERPEGATLYDSAWSSHVFEHISDPAPIFRGLRNWLKPGARMLISVPLGTAYDDPGHVNHFYSAAELKSFLNSYIDVNTIDICQEYQVIRAVCIFD